MRRNTHIIDQSDILTTIVEKIEISYPEDVSLLICYGSYITGDYGAMSDIDFFFVPKTKRGYALGDQFILNNIGYDLWPVSWERLTRISNLEEQIASILMDGKVLFASSEDELHKFNDLKKNLDQHLNNTSTVKKVSLRFIKNAKAIYFDIQNYEHDSILMHAMNMIETLLFAIALINGTYTQKGLKQIEQEIKRFSMIPAGFLELYKKFIRTANTSSVQDILGELIIVTENLWKAQFENDKKTPDISELRGFYEEFKSTYNKLLLACDEKNYDNAYYAAFMIDRETQSFLRNHTEPETFPNMIKTVIRNDFESVRVNCIEHEQQLIKLLDQHGVRINTHSDSHEFRQYFLERSP
ncbi:hypothetical protein ACFLXQ_05770 [Chloroflexota bacterium]